jgi:predicted dehydrogenase
MTDSLNPLGIGMVGAGMIGQLAHLANFVGRADCRLVGLAELRPKLGTLAISRFGIDMLYPDHQSLLADPRVDAVVVVTRRPATGPIVEAALQSGRHVLSEKPMAHTVDQALRLVSAANIQKHYVIGYMKRHDEGIQKAKILLDSIIKNGELGQIQLVRSWCFEGDIMANSNGYDMTSEDRPDGLELWPIAPAWVPNNYVDSYANFLNVHIHMLNLLRYLFNETPKVRHATLDKPSGQMVYFDFLNFGAVHMIASMNGFPWSEGIEILFDHGRLLITLPPPLSQQNQAQVILWQSGRPPMEVAPAEGSWAFQRQAAAFVTDILEGHLPIANGMDSMDDIILTEAIWKRALGIG